VVRTTTALSGLAHAASHPTQVRTSHNNLSEVKHSHLYRRLALLVTIEYAWNVFPSTSLSSGVLLGAHVVLLIAIWFGFPEGLSVAGRVDIAMVQKKQL
jgi:uncharacterized membrane protein